MTSSMDKPIITLVVAIMTGFTMSDTMITMAQPSGNSSHNNTTTIKFYRFRRQKYSCNFAGSNKTNANSTPTISVSNEDFWKIFGPLFELSTNTTRE